MNRKQLQGQRIAALVTDGFELVELLLPLQALRAAGATVDIVSLRPGRILGMNLHLPARRVRVNRTLTDARPHEYDALFIPGGFINPDLLRQSSAARAFVREFDTVGKPIATLCHGPWLLASAGVARGRLLTSWPGIRDDLVNAGATWLDQEVVQDGNWVSSRGPQDIQAFIEATLRLFAENNAVRLLTTDTAAPQRNTPPEVVIGVMQALPRPYLRLAGVLGTAAAGLWAWQRHQGFTAKSKGWTSAGPMSSRT